MTAVFVHGVPETPAVWRDLLAALDRPDTVALSLPGFDSAAEIEEFTPVSLAANDTDVLTVVRCRARSRSTGKTLATDLHHYFKFRDGKIAYYRGTEDTAQTEAVLRD